MADTFYWAAATLQNALFDDAVSVTVKGISVTIRPVIFGPVLQVDLPRRAKEEKTGTPNTPCRFQSLVFRLSRILDSVQDLDGLQRNHFAWLSWIFEYEWSWASFLVPFCHGPLQVRMDRVKEPFPVASSLLYE